MRIILGAIFGAAAGWVAATLIDFALPEDFSPPISPDLPRAFTTRAVVFWYVVVIGASLGALAGRRKRAV